MEKRLNFKVPAELHQQIKIECAKRNMSMTEFLIEAAKEKLAANPQPRDEAG